MAYGIATSTGAAFLSPVVTEREFDPVYDTAVNLDFLYQLLPSWYRNYMEDREIVEKLWSSFLQTLSAEILNLWQVDYSGNLRDVPVISQRKWNRFDFVIPVSFDEDPGLELLGREDSFAYDSTLRALTGGWVSRGGIDRAFVRLRERFDERASFSWSFKICVDQTDPKSAALFGYFDSEASVLANAICAGLVGASEASDELYLALLHYAPSGSPAVSVSSVELSLDVDYQIDCHYVARTGQLLATAIELRKLKVSGTCETAASVLLEAYTGTLEDPSIDFDALQISTGDTFVYEGNDYKILSVDGFTLTVSPPTLPVSASISYTIVGPEEVDSLALNLPADSFDPTFEVDLFGTAILDIRSSSSALFSPPGASSRKELAGRTWGWTYSDPTTEQKVLRLPRLQNRITSPDVVLYENLDYTIVAGESGSSFLFQEPPAQVLWAEYVGYDEGFLKDNFGGLIGLKEGSSEAYKSKVRGLFYSYFQGPTLSAIKTGVHILLGLPIADEPGIVESINDAYSGTLGQLRISGTDYYYPLSVGTELSVNDSVKLFQPLSNGVEVVDYISSPRWWVNLQGFNEIEKFHSFAVYINLDVFDLLTLQFAASFVNKISPTWKDPYFFVYKSISDAVSITDTLALNLILELWDVPGDGIIVLYDSQDYGDGPDWLFDQGTIQWGATSGAIRSTATELTGVATLTTSSTSATAVNSDWLTSIGGPGSVSEKHVAVARYFSGDQGTSVAGSNVFSSPSSSFGGVVAGDSISIVGVGTFEVQSVDSDTSLTLDSPLEDSAEDLEWETIGRFSIWGTVDSVSSDTSLTFATAFGGETGTYILALINNDYLNIVYDQFAEAVPDEEVVFAATLSPGYGESLLTGSLTFTESSTAVSGTGTDFENELGSGSVSDVYIVLPDGTWAAVSSVASSSALVLSTAAHLTFTEVPSFVADEVLAGTFTFSENSTAVTASTSQTGVISAGDFIQVVPGATGVVEVAAINGSGLSITLTANYVEDAVGVKVIRRGGSGLFPLVQPLPDTQTTTASFEFTEFGQTLTSTLEEP